MYENKTNTNIYPKKIADDTGTADVTKQKNKTNIQIMSKIFEGFLENVIFQDRT